MSEAGVIIALQRIFLASRWGEWSAIALARVWVFLFVPLLIAVNLGTPKERHAVREALWSAGVALLAGEILSLFILRARPFLAVQEIVAMVPTPLTSSFPSLHTAASVAMTAALFHANRHAGWLGVLITFGVVIGRVTVGVHYPTDILGGILLGLCSYAIVRLGHAALRKRKHVR